MKTPAELARAACLASKVKGSLSVRQMLLMGILAGAYIAFAGWLMTVVSHDMPKFSEAASPGLYPGWYSVQG